MSDLFNLWTSRKLIDKDSLTKTLRDLLNDPNRRSTIMKAYLQKWPHDDPFEFERKIFEGSSCFNLLPECIDNLRATWNFDNDEPFFVFVDALFEVFDGIETRRHDIMRQWMTPFNSAVPKTIHKDIEIDEELKPDEGTNADITPSAVHADDGDECDELNYIQNLIADLLPEIEPEASEDYKKTIRNEFVSHALNQVLEKIERQAELNIKKMERRDQWLELNAWLKKTAQRENEISQMPDYMKRLTLEHLREIFLSYDDLIENLRYRRHIEQPISHIWDAITPDFHDADVETKPDENDPPLGSKPSSPSTALQQEYQHKLRGEDIPRNILPSLLHGGVGFSELAQRLQMVSPVRVNLSGLRELVQSVPGVTGEDSSSSVDLDAVCL